MGDISAEPSMEDILSSIKRIIAEEGETATAASRARRPARPVAARQPITFGHDEILELSDPFPTVDEEAPAAVDQAIVEQPAAEPEVAFTPPVAPVADPVPAPRAAPADPILSPRAAPADPILSPRTAEASRGALDALSRLIVKPEVEGGDTLEALVREMLRPMLRDWLDANLPAMVENMVSQEIARITGNR